CNGIVNGRRRQRRVQSANRRTQIPCENDVARVRASERSCRSESFVIPRVNAFPPKLRFQMFGEGGLHKPVFAVDVSVGHASERSYTAISPLIRRGSRRSRAIRSLVFSR